MDQVVKGEMVTVTLELPRDVAMMIDGMVNEKRKTAEQVVSWLVIREWIHLLYNQAGIQGLFERR